MIDRWVEYFSNAIVNLMQIIDPNIIVVGGAVIHHNQWLIDSVIESAKKKVLPHLKENIKIVLTEFGPDAGMIGASYSIYKKTKGA